MDETSLEGVARLMGLEIPGHPERMNGIFGILNSMDSSTWFPRTMSENRGLLEEYLRVLPDDKLASADRVLADMDELWRFHSQTRVQFIRHADRCPSVALDPETQVRYLEGLLKFLKSSHEADEKVMAFLEQAYLFFEKPLMAGNMGMLASRVRRNRLWETSKVVAQLPWTAVYLKDYLWEPQASGFLEEIEANSVAVAAPRPDHHDCSICQGELTSDPNQEGGAGERTMPTDNTVLEVPQFVCPTCQHPFHSHCAISWFAQQQQMKIEALEQAGELEEDSRSSCAMCRGAVDDSAIVALYHLEIARNTSWAEMFARINGKNANPTVAS